MKCGCNCNCGGKDKVTKFIQEERHIHFLMGLNESYASARGNILMITPLPNVNMAYSLLIQNEKQREAYLSHQHPGESSFSTVNQNIQKLGSYDYKEKGKLDSRKNNLICSYCKKPGHTIDKCYRIMGSPTDFKFTKSKRTQAGMQEGVYSNAVLTEENNHGENRSSTQQFSREQFSQLIHFLQQIKIGQSGTLSSEAEVVVNTVVCSGITNPIHNLISCFTHIKFNSWIINSGASQHMAFDVSIFSNLTHFPTSLVVNLPNSQKFTATHKGTVKVLPDLVLENVLLIHDFNYNLLSVKRLCHQYNRYLIFSSTNCFFAGPFNEEASDSW